MQPNLVYPIWYIRRFLWHQNIKHQKIHIASLKATLQENLQQSTFFTTQAFSKKEAARQINARNGWLTRRAPTGCAQEPLYQLSTAKVEYEFTNFERFNDFLEQNPDIKNHIVADWQL